RRGSLRRQCRDRRIEITEDTIPAVINGRQREEECGRARHGGHPECTLAPMLNPRPVRRRYQGFSEGRCVVDAQRRTIGRGEGTGDTPAAAPTSQRRQRLDLYGRM